MDVCDDSSFAQRAKAKFHQAAVDAGVPAVTSGGKHVGFVPIGTTPLSFISGHMCIRCSLVAMD